MDSLAYQTYGDFDVLIYDDGSEDETRHVIDRYRETDRRFRLVGESRVGIVEALCRAVAASDAPLLARMDGDDISHPERLADTLAFLDESPETAVVGTLVTGFPEKGLGPGMGRYIDWLNRRRTAKEIGRDIFIESPLCHPSVVMRRDPYAAVGGYIDDGGPEDYGLWLRLHQEGFSMAKIPRYRFSWRDSSSRLSRTDSRYDRHRFIGAKVAVLQKMHLTGRPPVSIWGAGKIGRMFSRALSRVGHSPVAFIDIDPNKIGRRIHGVEVIGVPGRWTDIPSEMVLLAVGARGARKRIKAHLEGLGLKEGCHFISVA